MRRCSTQAGVLGLVVAALGCRSAGAAGLGQGSTAESGLDAAAAAEQQAELETLLADHDFRALSEAVGRHGKLAITGPRRDARYAALMELTAEDRAEEDRRLERFEAERGEDPELRQVFEAFDPDSLLEEGEELYGGLPGDGLDLLDADEDGNLVNYDEEVAADLADAHSLMERQAATFFEGAGERFVRWLKDTWEDDVNDTAAPEASAEPPVASEGTGASLLELEEEATKTDAPASSGVPGVSSGATAADSRIHGFGNGIAGQFGQISNHVAGITGVHDKIATSVNNIPGLPAHLPAGGLVPSVPLPGNVQGFKDGLTKAKDLWAQAKLTNVEVQQLKKMDVALEPFKKCLATLPSTESQYSPTSMVNTFQTTASTPPNFEPLTKAVLSNYLDKLAPDVSAVMGELGSTKLSSVKAIVEGNLQSFTVKNACEPTWVEHTADQAHALYTWILKQKGFGAAKCGEDYLVQNSYKLVKSVLLETTKSMVSKICTYWKKIEPKAMTWIGQEVGSFLIQRPQGYRFIAEESLVVAQKCFNRTQQQISKVKGYVGNLKMRLVSAATFYNTKDTLQSNFIQNKARLEEEEVLISTAETTLRGWVKAFEPLVMSNVVHPVLSQGVNIVSLIVSEMQSALEGLFGMIPYAGGVMYNVLAQVVAASQHFLSGKLVDIGMMSVAGIFASVRKAENQGANLNFIAKMAAKAVDAATSTTGAAAAADQDLVGVSSGIKSHEDYMPDAYTLDVENAIFKSHAASLRPLAAVVHVMMGLLRGAMQRIKRRLASCDKFQTTLKTSFGAATWNSDQSKWAPV